MPDRQGLKPARVFLALWPNAALRKRLTAAAGRLHQALDGRPTRPDTIHLTLVFIGNLARGRLAELVQALHSLSAVGFEAVFDQAECWRHSRIGFLAPNLAPEGLFQLVSMLETRLEQMAIPFDRRPYKPHITLLRQAHCPGECPAAGLDCEPIEWPAKDFVLVESVASPEGASYRILERYPLL